MTDAMLKDIEAAVRKAKRIAAERAAELHDLVEERLPAAYAELPEAARAAYEACRAWAVAEARLKAAQLDAAA
jgi:hypothetical protein